MLLIAKRTAREMSLFKRKSVKKTRRKTRLLVRNMARMKLHLVLARSMVERERKMRAGKENLAVNTPRPCTWHRKYIFSWLQRIEESTSCGPSKPTDPVTQPRPTVRKI